MKKLSFSNIKFKIPNPKTIIIFVVFILVVAGLLYINTHPPIRHSIIRFFNPEFTPIEYQMSVKDTEATLFERVDDKVLLLSSEGLTQADKTLNTKVFSAQAGSMPQIESVKDNYIQFFSGSKVAYMSNGGDAKEIKNENNIITATVNKNGYYAIVTEEKGYKALITVYDDDGEEIFKWHSADNFIVDLSLSPDNKTLAASMVNFGHESQKNTLTVFKFSEEKPISVTEVNTNFIADIKYISNGKILLVGSDLLEMYSTNGEKIWNVSYEGEKLVDYSISDDFIVVANLSSAALMGRCEVNIYDYGGRRLSEFDNAEDIVDLDSAGDTILITNKKSIRTITKKGVETNNIKFAKDIKHGLLFGSSGYAAIVTGNVLHSVKIN